MRGKCCVQSTSAKETDAGAGKLRSPPQKESPVKENPSVERIGERLNKILESFGSQWIKVSVILSQLELAQDSGKKGKFSIESLFKLHVLRRIKGFVSYNELLEKITEEDALNLGFFRDESNKIILPPKRTFNHLFKLRVTNDEKNQLDKIAELILRAATQHGKILDIELVQKAVKQHRENKRKSFKEAVKLVKRLVYPQIEIKMHHNARFTTRDLLDVLVHVAQSNDFAHNGSITFSEINPESPSPSSWTILHHLGKLDEMEKVRILFEKVFDVIFSFAKREYRILRERKVDIALDVHNIPYYGDRNDSFALGGKHERGTSHFLKFLTCAIVVGGTRFTLNAIPIQPFDALEDLVEEIIVKAKEKVRINRAYLDRGFDSPRIINILQKHHVCFVMPKVRSLTVKSWFDKSEDKKARVVSNFKIGTKENQSIVNLVLVDDEEGIKRAFITNMDIPEPLAHYMYEWYAKRWGIETSYRNMDKDFKPRTTSKNYIIRLFYFLFSVCLYNLWVLVNLCIALKVHGRVVDKPIISAKLFAVILCRIREEFDPG